MNTGYPLIRLFFLTWAGLALTSQISLAEDQLCCFDSKVSGDRMGCGEGMDAEITEIKREAHYSIVHVKVVNRGTYAGIIMYQNCCFSKIAKARGYRYFISLEENKIAGCEDCEWHDEYSLHFSNSRDDLFELSSKDKFENAEDIIDINELSMVCGYLPIPSSPFLHAVYFNDLNTLEDLLEKDKSLPRFMQRLRGTTSKW